jgi:hypothetical protein
VLMPPQQPQTPANTPSGNSNPDYNFIFNGQQQPKKLFRLPGSNNTAKLAALIVGGAVILGILIIILSSLLGPKINTKEITEAIGQGVEISRVSNTVIEKSHDLNTSNLASTTSAALTSEEVQLNDYLNKNKKHVGVKAISLYKNSKTDAELDAADQSNHLSEYYYSYLKKNLTDYQTALKTASETASGPNLKNMTQGYILSTQTILKTQQLASN